MNDRIIGFAGRCYSGKSELAKICEKNGYEIASFATPLKQLVANVIDVPLSEINKLKKVNNEYIINDDKIRFISEETEIPFDVVKSKVEGKIFKNTRELLQIIGTDIIREYNTDWHVNKLRKSLSKDKKYVFDDVRFPNERFMIEELGGTCWFVVRPLINNVSNHISETSLKWQDFDNIIINDKTLEYLIFNWELFLNEGYLNSLKKRQGIIYDIINEDIKIEDLIKNKSDFNLMNTLFINEYPFTYSAKYFRNNENINIIKEHNGYVSVILKSGEIDVVKNPLIIEDLKMFV